VFQELAWIAENGDTQRQREAAEGALKNMLARGYTPVAMLPVDRGIAAEVALKLRIREVIPHEEENDSLIVVEAAMKGCSILLSSDDHLAGSHENSGLWKILEDSDVENPKIVVARPRDIVKKFMPKR
jgi:hypothetical protein